MASQSEANPSTEPEPQQEETFKDQLDRAATESRSRAEPQKPNPIVEKITEYVPAAAKILGGGQEEQPGANESSVPGPPHRPDHDTPIEEFVRDQHRSKIEEGDLGGPKE